MEKPFDWRKSSGFSWKAGGEKLLGDRAPRFTVQELPSVIAEKIAVLANECSKCPKDVLDFLRDLQKKNANGTLDLLVEKERLEGDYRSAIERIERGEGDTMGSTGIKLALVYDLLGVSEERVTEAAGEGEA